MNKTLFLVNGSPQVAKLLFSGLCTTYSHESIEWIEIDRYHGQHIEGFFTGSTPDQLRCTKRAMKERCQAIIVSVPPNSHNVDYFILSREYNYQVIVISAAQEILYKLPE